MTRRALPRAVRLLLVLAAIPVVAVLLAAEVLVVIGGLAGLLGLAFL